jgi:hypothetical protein
MMQNDKAKIRKVEKGYVPKGARRKDWSTLYRHLPIRNGANETISKTPAKIVRIPWGTSRRPIEGGGMIWANWDISPKMAGVVPAPARQKDAQYVNYV